MKIIQDNFPPFIKKWLSLLKLDNDHFIFCCEEEHDNAFECDNIKYIPEKKTFRIQIKYPYRRYCIVHELGHLYLAKQMNDMDLIITPNPDSNLMDMRILLNGMMDGFVNYRLIEFEEFYTYFLEKYQIGKYLYLTEETNFFEVLDKFIMLIIDYDYIIKEPDRNLRIAGRNKSLEIYRESILDKAKELNINLSRQTIQTLEKTIMKFRLIKDSMSFEKIMYFMFLILNTLKLWDEQDVKKLLSQMFDANFTRNNK